MTYILKVSVWLVVLSIGLGLPVQAQITLSFPLPNKDQNTVTINSYFDHSMATPYCYDSPGNKKADTKIIIYTGREGNKKLGESSDKYGPFTDCNKDGKIDNKDDILSGLKTAQEDFLYYDGHPGYDFKTRDQSSDGKINVLAAAPGTVISVSSSGTVIIRHTNDYVNLNEYTTHYLHLDSWYVNTNPKANPANVKVDRCQIIGRSGGRGTKGPNQFAPHLHFEVRWNNIPIDPYGWQDPTKPDPYTQDKDRPNRTASLWGLTCPYLLLASRLNSPWNLAIDSTSVYWVENNLNGVVKKVPIQGGLITTLATGLVEPSAIAVDSTHVYWIERNNGNGKLKKVNKNGGSVITLIPNPSYPTGLNNAQNFIVLDTNNIYFADGKSGGGGAIRKISKNGGAVTTLVDKGILNLRPAIATDGTYVYFTDDLGNIKRVSVNATNVDASTIPPLGSGNPLAMTLDSSNIYWTEYSGGTVKKMHKGGGSATTLASGLNSPSGIVVDATHVYVVEFSWPGAVKRIPINGGNVTTLATEANTIGIAVDKANVYWAISTFIDRGKIARLEKTGKVPVRSAVSALSLVSSDVSKTQVGVILDRKSGIFRFVLDQDVIQDLQLNIFNLSGRLIYHTDWVSNGFEWDLLNDREQRLANGVYLYVVTIRKQDGTILRSQVKKLVILR